MISFLISLTASLLAAALWEVVGRKIGSLRTPLDYLASLAGGGVMRRFKNLAAAQKLMERALTKSSSIRVFAVRGFLLSQETHALHSALRHRYNPTVVRDFRVLLIDPSSTAAARRAREYNSIRKAEEPGTYLSQITESINVILDMKKVFSTLSVKLHAHPVVCRFVILDDVAFLSFYDHQLTGLTSPVLALSAKGLLYDFLLRFFDETWEQLPLVNEKLSLATEPTNADHGAQL